METRTPGTGLILKNIFCFLVPAWSAENRLGGWRAPAKKNGWLAVFSDFREVGQ
jgi:hypothetical protein